MHNRQKIVMVLELIAHTSFHSLSVSAYAYCRFKVLLFLDSICYKHEMNMKAKTNSGCLFILKLNVSFTALQVSVSAN
jgi:hypothetical protein